MQTNKKAQGMRLGQTKITQRSWKLLSLAALPILWVLVFKYLPMGGLVIAFKHYRVDKGIFGSDWAGFQNFEFFLTSNDFSRVAWNTIKLNMIFIVVGMICAVALAIMLYELTDRKKTKIFETILITPHFVSWVVTGYVVYALLTPEYGVVNNILQSMGKDKINFYAEPELWSGILTVAYIWKHVGMDSILYYAALMGIDTTYFEAAELDGASKWQIIWYIIIPSLKSVIIIQLILKIGGIFRADFGLFYQLTQNSGLLYSATDVMDTWIYRSMTTMKNYGMTTAAGLVQSLVGFVLVVVTNKIVNKVDSESALF